MKVCLTDKNSLLSALQLAQGIVEKKAISPVLSSIVITAKPPDTLEIKCTNLEESLYVKTWAEVYENAAFALSAKKLMEFVRELPDMPIEIFVENDAVAEMSVGRIKATFPLVEIEDFPELPRTPEKTVLLNRDAFLDAIEKVYFSIATDSVSTALMGMLFTKKGDVVHFVSTDGHRLSVVEKRFEIEDLEFEMIIPRKGVQELKKILDKKIEVDAVDIGFSENHFFMRAGNIEFFTRVLDAKYPNYERVIPDDFERSFVVASDTLFKAVKRVSLFSEDKAKSIKFELVPEEKRLVLSSVKSPDDAFSGIAVEELELVDAEGEPITFGLNARFLLEALNAFDAETVRFNLGDALCPIKLESDESRDYIHVIMPVSLEE